jgi:hypothetical protein
VGNPTTVFSVAWVIYGSADDFCIWASAGSCDLKNSGAVGRSDSGNGREGVMYQSTHIFDGEDFYLIVVYHGCFPTREAAEEFGNQLGFRLKREGGKLVYYYPVGRKVLTDDDITVERLSDEAIATYRAGNPGIDGCDFHPVDIKIKDFGLHEGLCRGFESTAYGVRELPKVVV